MEEYYKHKLLSQSTMSNPTLINGFEDIVTFIKQQEHRNQKLKEENEKLKEENDDLNGRLEDVNHTAEEWEDSYNELKEEKNELWKETEELTQKIETLKEEIKKQKKEHIKSMMETKRIGVELYREVKYALGYGESDEPDRKAMYDEIKWLTKYAEIMGDIDGDQLADLLKDHGWEYNDDGELEKKEE